MRTKFQSDFLSVSHLWILIVLQSLRLETFSFFFFFETETEYFIKPEIGVQQRAEERQKKQGEQKTNLTFSPIHWENPLDYRGLWTSPKLGYFGYLDSLCQVMSCCVVNPFQVLHFPAALKRTKKLKRALNKRTQHPITIFLSFWSGYNLMIFFFFSQEYGTRFQIFTPKKKFITILWGFYYTI